MHDTPDRDLFRLHDRDLSSGCIRVERPLELALWLLADDPAWSRDELERALAGGRTRTVLLRELVPVHIQYWTAWVDAAGRAQFRRDLYGHDRRLDSALAELEKLRIDGHDHR